MRHREVENTVVKVANGELRQNCQSRQMRSGCEKLPEYQGCQSGLC